MLPVPGSDSRVAKSPESPGLGKASGQRVRKTLFSENRASHPQRVRRKRMKRKKLTKKKRR